MKYKKVVPSVMWVLSVVLMAAGAVGAGFRQFTDEEYHSMPKLFHQDNYERCLAKPQGLYCMGSFKLVPTETPHRVYDIMKEYTSDKNHFDRTLLHRGYCVSTRCPFAQANLTNRHQNILRFEACVSRWARPMKLRARLQKLNYCRTRRDTLEEEQAVQRDDSPHQLWLQIVTALLVFNGIGTVYDIVLGDDLKKNRLLMAWSLRSNWQRLTASYENGDEKLNALAPLQGLRVFLLAIVVVAHAGNIHHMLYLHNPEYLEWMSAHPLVVIIQNGASIVQVFVLLSSFMLAYNLLLFSKQQELSFKMLPKIILSRVLRIAPVSLLVIGFASTWWSRMRDGAQWQAVVAAESSICRRKFWAHALFINNFVEPEKHCLLQNWFLAVDMQLYILAAILTLSMARLDNARRMRLLAQMFVAACGLNLLLAYIFNLKSLLFIMKPETIRTLFAGSPSFSWLYAAPWGSLPATLLGLLMAHLHFAQEESGKPLKLPRWFLSIHWLGVFLPIFWILTNMLWRDVKSPIIVALLTAADRPMFTLISAIPIYAACKQLPAAQYRFCAWHGWRVLARLSLSVLALHWSIDMLRAAPVPSTVTSLFDFFADGLSTWGFTYTLAVPLTLMVEMPIYRSASALI